MRAALFGTLAALLCGEVGLRVLGYTPHFVNPIASFHVPDEEIGLRGRPGFAGRFAQPEFDVFVRLDERGFREVARAERRLQATSRRLFVLGDSFTWGWGVDQGAGFVDHLATAHPAVEVHNLGLSGTGTVVAHQLLVRHALSELRSGDGVLLVTFENDLGDNLGRNHDRWVHAAVDGEQVRLVPARAAGNAGHVKAWFKEHSCLFNLTAFVADRFKLSRRQAQAALAPERGSDGDVSVDADEVLCYRHFLSRMHDAVTERGASFAVACIPPRGLYEGQPRDGSAEARRHAAMLEGPRSLGIATLDLLPALSAPLDEGSDPLTFAFDEHWTATGHRIAATALVPFVGQLLDERIATPDAVRRR